MHILLPSLLHFLVDGLCACGLMLMSRQITSDVGAYAMIVLYDVLAFGTQPFTGHWVDGTGTHPYVLKLTVTLLAGGVLISSFPVSPAIFIATTGAILLGMGNSLFHVE